MNVHEGVRLDDLTIGYPARRTGLRTRVPESVLAAHLEAHAPTGQLTALLGPNGAGKSTLLRTICGLQPPLTGRALIDGIDVAEVRPADLARTVAVVLTERVDPGFLDVREIVSLGRTPHLGIGARMTADDLEIVEWAMTAAGVEDLADRMAGELSDGQRQRVMTARALAQQPRLLVLDEPTSYLDVPSRVELLDLLATLARDEQIAVLVSTHELELALRLADQVWLLPGDGHLTRGDPSQVANEIAGAFDRGRLHFDPDALQFDIDVTK